ncbi:MAG: hypothetical protein KBT10_10310 [Bacteroidales bacterium]|nr:hypothetical protein [Candidatus Sodaliphilus aphodohippi]
MRKIITIAESVLDTIYHNGQPVKSFTGGRIPCAAASLAQTGITTVMLSECTTDWVGDIVVDYLKDHRVNVDSIDRYPEGRTAMSAIMTEDGKPDRIINYGLYPDKRFKVAWPRIEKDDIVIFGSLYSIDLPQREHVNELIQYAMDRRAIIIYLPGFQHGIDFRITRVMPGILENIEYSDIIIAHDKDINTIFPGETVEQAFNSHIKFERNCYIHLHSNWDVMVYNNMKKEQFSYGGTKVDNMLGWQAGFTAGIAYMLIKKGITREELTNLDRDTQQQILDEARQWAMASLNEDNCIDRDFAASRCLEQSV